MKLFLTKNRILKGDSSLIGYCRENKCECLNIQVMDQSLWTKQAYLEFQVNENEKYTTEALDMTSGVISYPVPNGLLIEHGNLKMQVVIRDEEMVWKSSIKIFTIDKSICAGDDVVIEYPTGNGSNGNSLEVVDLSEYKYGDLVPQETMDKLVRLEEKVAIYYRNKMWYLLMKYDDSIKYHCNYVDGEDFSIVSGDLYIDLTDGTLSYDEFERRTTDLEIISLPYEDGDIIPKSWKDKIIGLNHNVLILWQTMLFHKINDDIDNDTYFYYGHNVDSEHKQIQSVILRINKTTGKLSISNYGRVNVSSENKMELIDLLSYDVWAGVTLDETIVNTLKELGARGVVNILTPGGSHIVTFNSGQSVNGSLYYKTYILPEGGYETVGIGTLYIDIETRYAHYTEVSIPFNDTGIKKTIKCNVDYDEIVGNVYVFDLSTKGTYLITNYGSEIPEGIELKFNFGTSKKFSDYTKVINKSSLENIRKIFDTDSGYSFGSKCVATSTNSYFIGIPLNDSTYYAGYFFIKVTDNEVEVFLNEEL